jgi:hypothetical protein
MGLQKRPRIEAHTGLATSRRHTPRDEAVPTPLLRRAEPARHLVTHSERIRSRSKIPADR